MGQLQLGGIAVCDRQPPQRAIGFLHVHGAPVRKERYGKTGDLLQRAFVVRQFGQGGAGVGEEAGGPLGLLAGVMSRAIFDAPMILPSALLTGEIVRDTSTRLPSFRNRTVSKCSIRSPRLSCSMICRQLVGVFGRDEDRQWFADDLLGGVAVKPLRTFVPADDDAVEGLADDGVVGGLHDG